MSENGSRWDVDTTDRYPNNATFRMTSMLLTDAAPGWLKFEQEDRQDVRDFIIELVHKIEQLETDNIEQQDAIDAAIRGNNYIINKLDEMIAMAKA